MDHEIGVGVGVGVSVGVGVVLSPVLLRWSISANKNLMIH